MITTYYCFIFLVYVHTSPIFWLYFALPSAILKRELYGYPKQQMCAQTDTVLAQVLKVSNLYSGTDTVPEF